MPTSASDSNFLGIETPYLNGLGDSRISFKIFINMLSYVHDNVFSEGKAIDLLPVFLAQFVSLVA